MEAQEKSMRNATPLEKLRITIIKNGVPKDIQALHAYWSKHRLSCRYQPPPTPDVTGALPVGAKEDWMARTHEFVNEMKWLLQLEHHRFWSQILYSENTADNVFSLLQEATPYYMLEEFPEDDDMWNVYKEACYHTYLVINRLATVAESDTEIISSHHLGKLLYDNYLFTVPMMLDVALLYGRQNKDELNKLFSTVMKLQPRYWTDLEKAVSDIERVLDYVQMQLCGGSNSTEAPVKIPTTLPDMTLPELRDMVIHTLDVAASLHIFMDVFPPAARPFADGKFDARVAAFYEDVMPVLYRRLNALANKEGSEHIYADLNNKLGHARLALLSVVRSIWSDRLETILEGQDVVPEGHLKHLVEGYISALNEALATPLFMRDLHRHHPVDHDLDILAQLSEEVAEKCDFLVEAIWACHDGPKPLRAQDVRQRRIKRRAKAAQNGDVIPPGGKRLTGVRLDSLISEVKDILPTLGEGFVERCLQHYDYSSASVVNAILEDSLPESLRSVDRNLSRLQVKDEPLGTDLLDDLEDEEYESATAHIGKKESEHRNMNELLDDKSHVKELGSLYSRLGLVEEYDDEYDDTYEDPAVGVREPGEEERRPLVLPRVLQSAEHCSREEEEVEEEEQQQQPQEHPPRDQFVPNPEETRAKAEQRRQDRRGRGGYRGGSRGASGAGPPRGGADSADSHKKKTINKSSRGNHNRRRGAQSKLRQGMVPS